MKQIKTNIADTTGIVEYKEVPTKVCPDMKQLFFDMQDNYHEFQIGLKTILECIIFAEREEQIPKLPLSWYTDICTRYDIPFDLFSKEEETKEEEKNIIIEKNINIYNTVRNYFDKIIDFAELKLGFKISNTLARELIEVYYASESWLYPHSTVNNIPFMLLYLHPSVNPYGLWIRKDSWLFDEINKIKDLTTEPTKSDKYVKLKTTEYLHLTMMVWNHKCQETENGELKEYLTLQICKDISNTGFPEWVELVDKKIPIVKNEFVRFINSPNALKYRNETLLEYAKEIMPEISIQQK